MDQCTACEACGFYLCNYHTESLLRAVALVSFSFVMCGDHDEKQFSNNFFLECLCVVLYGQMVGLGGLWHCHGRRRAGLRPLG